MHEEIHSICACAHSVHVCMCTPIHATKRSVTVACMCAQMVLAGYETTSTALCDTLYMLMEHPDVMVSDTHTHTHTHTHTSYRYKYKPTDLTQFSCSTQTHTETLFPAWAVTPTHPATHQ